TSVNGTPIKTYAELIAVLVQQPDKPATLSIDRQPQSADRKVVAAAGTAETVAVEIPPQLLRSTGMTMTALPVKAVQDGSPAAAAGIEPGDRLLAIAGDPVGDPLTLDERLRKQAGETVKLTFSRDGADREVSVTPRTVSWIEESRWPASPVSVSSLGVAIGVDALVAAVDAAGPAARAGIEPGERVTRVMFVTPKQQQGEEKRTADAGLELSERSPSWPYVIAALQQVDAGTRLDLVVESSAGTKRDVTLEPATAEDHFVVDRGLIFEPLTRLVRAGSFFSALRHGFGKAADDLSLVYKFLHKLTSNQISPRLLGGPIEIAKQAGKSAEEGFSRFLLFLTMLSANLAVVNFLPIPVLDGGHMVFLLYELVRGKPPSEGVVAALSYLGLALILTLMMFVFGLDLGLIPRR
ncbi:MAG: site-2 protease family protein, partial [Planctomycetota bacterium]